MNLPSGKPLAADASYRFLDGLIIASRAYRLREDAHLLVGEIEPNETGTILRRDVIRRQPIEMAIVVLTRQHEACKRLVVRR